MSNDPQRTGEDGPQTPPDDDSCDWYELGFRSLRDAENAWQCQAESRAEEQS